MQEEKEGALRKSSRTRTPNSFYTEGINELKRAPRPPREPQPKRKKSRVFQQQDNSIDEEPIEEERSETNRDNRDNGTWFPCKLPKNGTTVKVQFVLNQPDEIPEKKKQQSIAKPVKKADSSFDLLSLFQKAIQNVNQQVTGGKQGDQQYISKQARPKPQASLIRQRRIEDVDGKINAVQRLQQKLLFLHSKLGEVQVPFEGMSQQSESEGVDQQMVEELRYKIMNTNALSQLSIFN